MGSQGDAGQFRTPRHIIDFIVEIINPQKHETVLDPACGTGGFLISSYKHILQTNTDKKSGDLLSASDRKKVGENIGGYDISPEMIKLSLVNMYLHGFSTPDIEEYDTLSSEDKWNEYYDVILANPPFFSPSGGIQPHKRFGVDSKKAEVLFTSYILEHLKPNGRAGIIIPEGIIFQTGKAYKELRKQLIENALIGVISLPAGVFQPYSGVKTSILILDKKINKDSDSIFFAEVKNDGFDLRAQRGPIKENDLPQISTAIESGKEVDDIIFHIKKERILKDKSYNLTSRKYKEVEDVNSNYPLVPILEVYKVISPPAKIKSKEFLTNGKVPIVDQSQDQIAGYWNNEEDRVIVKNSVIIFGDHTKTIKFVDFDFVAGADGIKILNPSAEILPKFLFYIIKSIELPDLGYSRHYKELKDKKIPLPPLEVQQEIVDELEGYQKIIDGCKQVIENYKPTIDIDPSWEMVELGEILKITRGASPRPIQDFITDGEGENWIKIGDASLSSKYIYKTKQKITNEGAKKSKIVEKGDFILSNSMSFGRPYIMGTRGCIHDGWLLLKFEEDSLTEDFLYYILSSSFVYAQFKRLATGGVVNNLNKDLVSSVKIPLLNINQQNEITSKLGEERTVIEGNKKLIEIYAQKIQNRISKVWGEE